MSYKLAKYFKDPTPHHRERYGEWAGNPKGYKVNPQKCAVQVWDDCFHRARQCSRYRGHGPDHAFCKQHAEKQHAID